jgi:hypothetical protein
MRTLLTAYSLPEYLFRRQATRVVPISRGWRRTIARHLAALSVPRYLIDGAIRRVAAGCGLNIPAHAHLLVALLDLQPDDFEALAVTETIPPPPRIAEEVAPPWLEPESFTSRRGPPGQSEARHD